MSLDAMGNVLRAARRKPGDRLNILAFPTHERWQSGLAGCNADFFLFRGEGIKEWDHRFAPLPSNHTLLDPTLGEGQIPSDLTFDLILAQSLGQVRVAQHLSRRGHLPFIRMEHTLPPPSVPREEALRLGKILGHLNATCSANNREQWGLPANTRIVHHGIDTDFFVPGNEERKAHCLSVVNDFINRDVFCGYRIWKEATEGLPVHIVGNTPGLSEAAKDINELRSFYQQSEIFLNTTLVSSAPVSPLEAMACGCTVVSTDTTTMPELIEHGVTGFLGSTPQELAEHCRTLLADPGLCRKIGAAAREMVVRRFSIARFASDWDRIFQEASSIAYLGEP